MCRHFRKKLYHYCHQFNFYLSQEKAFFFFDKVKFEEFNFLFLALDSVKAEKKNSNCVEFNFTLFYLLLTRQTSSKNIRGIFMLKMER